MSQHQTTVRVNNHVLEIAVLNTLGGVDATIRSAYFCHTCDSGTCGMIDSFNDETVTDQTPIPAELTGPIRGTLARIDLATRALPRDMQQDVFELVEEAFHHGRIDGRTAAAADIRNHLTRRGQRVGAFPPITPDAALRDKAVIEAYETAAHIAENEVDQ